MSALALESSLQSTVAHLEQQAVRLREDYTAVDRKLQQELRAKAALNSDLRLQQHQVAQLVEQEARLRKQRGEADRVAETQLRIAREAVQGVVAENRAMRKQLAETRTRVRALVEELNRAKDDRTLAQEDSKRMEEQHERSAALFERLQAEMRRARQTFEKDTEELVKQRDDARRRLGVLENERYVSRLREGELEKMQRFEDENLRLHNENASLSREVEQLRRAQQNHDGRPGLASKYGQLLVDFENLQLQNELCEHALAESKAEVKRLKAKLASAGLSADGGVDALMR